MNEGVSPGPSNLNVCGPDLATFTLPGTNYNPGASNEFSWESGQPQNPIAAGGGKSLFQIARSMV